MIRYSVKYTLREPIVLPCLDSDESLVKTLDFLRGDYVLGAFAAAYQRHFQKPIDFRQRSVSFENAYLIIDGKPSFPTPSTYFVKKDAPRTIIDISGREIGGAKRLRAGYLTDERRMNSPAKRLTIHHGRSRVDGVDGDLFRYEALCPWQVFQGYVVLDDTQLVDELRECTADGMFLGISKDAEYGWVDVEIMEPSPIAVGDVAKADGLVFRSDALIRNSRGEIVPEFAALKDALGLPEECDYFVDTVEVGGFRGAWAMPMQRVLAVGKGSVIRFPKRLELSAQTLSHWRDHGIGERTEAGFGRVAPFTAWTEDVPINAVRSSRASNLLEILHSDAGPSEDFEDFINLFAISTYEAEVDRAVAAATGSANGATSSVNRVRQMFVDAEIALRAGAVPDMIVKDLKDDLKRIQKRKGASERYNVAKVRQKGLLEWVESQLNDGSDGPSFNLSIKGAPNHTLDDAQRLIFRVRYVHGVLRKITKEREKWV